MRRNSKLIHAISLLLLSASCSSVVLNPGLGSFSDRYGYRYDNNPSATSENSESLFVVLTFSGGGTRAAALAFGVLKELENTKIFWNGEKTLLDEVDVISSVSGGSFTSAYYALRGKEIFDGAFEANFLKADIQRALTRGASNPARWPKLLSPTYGRINLAADYYNRILYDGATFGTLASAGHGPFIIINSTDLSTGSRFEFTQNQFDHICSDLSKVRLADAVAASSAFPVMLSPITFRNWAGECEYKEPPWISNSLRDDFEINRRRFLAAREIRSYQDGANRPYIHLIDGGVADNIGLRGVINALTSNNSPWSLRNKINRGTISKLIVIVVNAKTEGDFESDRRRSAPSIRRVLSVASFAPMGNFSLESIELLKSIFASREREIKTLSACQKEISKQCPDGKLPYPPPRSLDFYFVEISFDSLFDAREHQFFTSLPTSFRLPAATVNRLRDVGGRLLRETKDFQRLKRDIAQRNTAQ